MLQKISKTRLFVQMINGTEVVDLISQDLYYFSWTRVFFMGNNDEQCKESVLNLQICLMKGSIFKRKRH